MAHERVPLDKFQEVFGGTTELSSVALGGKVLSFSDEFFADASNLLKIEPSASLKGQFGPKGSLFDGWETRRHNPAHDWVVIALGAPGTVLGFDLDTAHFNGNEAPAASVHGFYSNDGKIPGPEDEDWVEILPKASLGPSSRHLFLLPSASGPYTHLKLSQYPDGGIARFRAYGSVSPLFPSNPQTPLDLAHVLSGGQVVSVSDAHFSRASNILLPGRGYDMRDGWETRRSREKGHTEWAVIRLGAPGYLTQAEVDTAFFIGNFPESVELLATSSDAVVPEEDATWTTILPRTKTGPNKQHFFKLENVEGQVYSHVKVVMHPDGGMKRVRLTGTRYVPGYPPPSLSRALPALPALPAPSEVRTIPAEPLTSAAFAPFGQVLQAWADPANAPEGIVHTLANGGTAVKYHRLAPITSSYPEGSAAFTGISVYRSTPAEGAVLGATWPVKVLERHPHTNQAFIPMGRTAHPEGEEALSPNGYYLVAVAETGEDDKPNLSTLKAFVASTSQGVMYNQNTWHHPMCVLGSAIDFACIETQIGTKSEGLDCEIVRYGEGEVGVAVQIPQL
ncbi:allantoicase [Dacryopinax primogenitus]|uniref:Allantoicase n=1 Tax=Dacryopinax primogenitus (strain DJM 731) TaxID=1858805 RepID=M5GDA2_DACPD|nr:allantoicase [Dacryopinax primogenitus]EJU04387.1 allantoicase [Dacryopinax primogenitus]